MTRQLWHVYADVGDRAYGRDYARGRSAPSEPTGQAFAVHAQHIAPEPGP